MPYVAAATDRTNVQPLKARRIGQNGRQAKVRDYER
jgi:hypothetical protein